MGRAASKVALTSFALGSVNKGVSIAYIVVEIVAYSTVDAMLLLFVHAFSIDI